MLFDIEVLLRDERDPVIERAVHPREPREWTEEDVAAVLTQILLAVDRVKHPGGETPPVALRGFSWIVEPFDKGRVVIAIEIPMGAAVAGPFPIEHHTLDRLIARTLARGVAARPGPSVH